MTTSDVIAIASFALTIAAIIYTVGKNAQRLEIAEKDLNRLGDKVSRLCGNLDKRQDSQGVFIARLTQKVTYLEERVLGEETAARVRGE